MPRTIGDFTREILAVNGALQAEEVFRQEVARIRENNPEEQNPEKIVRSNIGFVFGEGMSIPHRRMWAVVCGAEHPGFGPEFTKRDFSMEEAFQAGMDMAAKWGKGVDTRPTAWQHLLRDED